MREISKTELVKKYILKEVKEGRITSGQRIPSCRKIAALFEVNKITVNKAYEQLEKEHRVFSIPRGGFYLVDSENRQAIVSKEVDFNTVRPDDKLIPYREFTHVINKAVDLYKNNLFDYESNVGLLTLRETLKAEFEKDGIYTNMDNILVTNGAQQGIDLAFQAIFSNSNGKLLVEVPTYNLAIKLGGHLGINMVGIERKIDGYDYKRMEEILKKGEITAFYIIPRHHNPTGYSLLEKDKKKVVELCTKYNVIIIEDDYLADLAGKKGAMPLHYYDMDKKTIYIRSFSKAFMPGIRLGAVIAPKSMLGKIASIKQLMDLNTSRLPQGALELFIKSGMYEKQIKKIRKSYEAKLRKIKEIFISLQPKDFIWNVPENGIFIWIKLPEYIDGYELQEKLKSQGILIKQAGDCFLEKEIKVEKFNYIRLCISGVSEENISAVATIISYILK
ncbi:PLP-dependent aminotransferase family protein [uncultured Clostridium sp.]|uniref:aminotransferase-like domain-containing protein n=1 Tax=uncultured Clostridium sp. TaxID=59620 RepID=UPI0028E5B716|nr:PLP-dependent aminotransferase family protein [uncultured Clostridium sp.]